MTAIFHVLGTVGMGVVFGCVARERATAYGLRLRCDVFSALASTCALWAAVVSPWPGCVALAAATVSAVSDLQLGLIFDRVTLCAIALTLAVSVPVGAMTAAAFGALSMAGTLFALYAVTAGRGLGLGDVKFAAVMGGALGPQDGFIALGIAFVCGAVVGVIRLWILGSRAREVRFGPYLAFGLFATLLVRGSRC